MRKHGNLTIERQPESELIYRPEGLIEGTIVFHFDWANNRTAVRRKLNTTHPDDPNVILYAMRETKLKLGIGMAVFDCIGLTKSPTDRIVQLVPSYTTEDIQTHPAFGNLAGTLETPHNGAEFDAETGEFLGWFGGGSVGTGLRGVSSYFAGRTILRATHYVNTRSTPAVYPMGCSIHTSPPNGLRVTGNANWLYMPPQADPVGTSGIYKVDEEWMGGGPLGWNTNVYSVSSLST